jgi:SAM-dependent methyltransferase
VDPALFYTGLVADLYRPLRSSAPDPDTYARFIERSGEPALELGCGDGDPLLELRRRGIDVEGVDSSADMLDRCRRAAAEQDLDVVVHHQRIEALDLSRRYRSIFLAGPTFNLLPTDDLASSALAGIRSHLDDGGSALVPLFIPEPTPSDGLGRVRESTAADGTVMRVSAIDERRDEAQRTQETTLRYERIRGADHTVEDRPWTLHWYTQDGFRTLAAGAGLHVRAVLGEGGAPATGDETAFAFVLQAAG